MRVEVLETGVMKRLVDFQGVQQEQVDNLMQEIVFLHKSKEVLDIIMEEPVDNILQAPIEEIMDLKIRALREEMIQIPWEGRHFDKEEIQKTLSQRTKNKKRRQRRNTK